MTPFHGYFTTADAARALRVHVRTIEGYIAAGKLRPVPQTLVRRHMFSQDELERFASERRMLRLLP